MDIPRNDEIENLRQRVLMEKRHIEARQRWAVLASMVIAVTGLVFSIKFWMPYMTPEDGMPRFGIAVSIMCIGAALGALSAGLGGIKVGIVDAVALFLAASGAARMFFIHRWR